MEPSSFITASWALFNAFRGLASLSRAETEPELSSCFTEDIFSHPFI